MCPYCRSALPAPDPEDTVLAACEAFARGIDRDIREYVPVGPLVLGFAGIAGGVAFVIWGRGAGLGTFLPAVIGVAAALAVIVVAAALLSAAERRYVVRVVLPKVERFRTRHGLSRERFAEIAARVVAGRSDGLAGYLDDLL